MVWEAVSILLSDWINECLNEKYVVVLILAIAVLRVLCERLMESFYLSNSPSSTPSAIEAPYF